MNPVVVWTFRGERQFHFLLSRLNRLPERVGVTADVTERLRLVFPDATAVVVRELYLGFRPRPEEYTFLVDVRYPEEGYGGTFVVKLAADPRLRLEFDAWLHTKEPQFNGDGVLMRQSAAYHPQRTHRMVGVIYQDATTHIGMSRQVSLEEAFIGAVRHDSPTVGSVVNCLALLFRSLGRELYAGRHRHQEPWTAALELNPDGAATGGRRRSLTADMTWDAGTPQERQASILGEWGSDAHRPVIQAVEAWTADVRLPFRSPVDFFRTVRRRLTENPSDPRLDFRLTRGPAHGDLHGRNVLVGLDDDRADRPAVYDYEHLNRENLILLDFAKLETELKVRAYPYLFGLDRRMDAIPNDTTIGRIHQMEAQLADTRQSEFAPLAGSSAAGEKESRLFALLRALRTLAWETSPKDDATRSLWDREHLLLLAAYGVYSLRFNQPPLCRTIALISAGTAAAAL